MIEGGIETLEAHLTKIKAVLAVPTTLDEAITLSHECHQVKAVKVEEWENTSLEMVAFSGH